MQIGTFTIDVSVDLSKLRTQLGQIQSVLEPLNKNMGEFSKSVGLVSKATNTNAESLTRLKQRAQETNGTTSNLGRSIREMTTSMFGNSVAVIALGTAIGNVLTQAVSRLVLGLVDAITQFGRLQNELTQVNSLMARTGTEMEFIVQQSRLTGRSIAETSQEWIALATQAQNTGGNIERARFAMVQFNLAMALNRQQTVLGAFGQLGTAIGGFVVRVEGATGASSALTSMMTMLTTVINRFADAMPRPQTNIEQMQARMTALEARQRTLQASTEQYANIADRAFGITRVQRLREITAQIEDLNEQLIIAQAAPGEPARLEARSTAMQFLLDQLNHEVAIGRMRTHEQQVQNRLFQIELQFRQMGLQLSREERSALEGRIRTAAAAAELESIRTSLLTAEQAEQESHERRLEMLRTFYQGRQDLTEEWNQRIAQENFRSTTQQQIIQAQNATHLLNAQQQAGQAVVNVLQLLGAKSKLAAVAAIALNTALSVAMAIQNTKVAALRALAELGPVAGPPVAAQIEAYGALQVGAIIAAGVLQGAAALKGGGSVPGRGSGGGQTATPVDEGDMPTRIVIEPVDPAMIFTGEQLNQLIEVINEKAADGTIVVANKIIG